MVDVVADISRDRPWWTGDQPFRPTYCCSRRLLLLVVVAVVVDVVAVVFVVVVVADVVAVVPIIGDRPFLSTPRCCCDKTTSCFTTQ